MKIIQKFLNITGMYRTVTISLSALALISIVAGFFGLLYYSGIEQIISLAVVLSVALLANVILAKVWKISANHESALITALILFFLVIPVKLANLTSLWIIVVVALLAIFSKFVLVRNKQHIVNPAAFGVLALALVYAVFPIEVYFEALWWIGTPVLFIPLLFFGGLVVEKVRKWPMVLSFIGVGFVVYLFETWRLGLDLLSEAPDYFLSGPSLFLAFFMLTEPFTTPSTRKLQMAYGALIGFISQTALFMSFLVIPPELAIVFGNLVFYFTTLKRKLILPLERVNEIAENTYEFIFSKPKGVSFRAGQYLEWMLPHKKTDNRGVRRYFTIASSPTESTLRIAVKIDKEKGSRYKKELLNMKEGSNIIASQLSGDFLLPKNTDKKLGFIAGGIGVTPFRSHIKYMIDSGNVHDTVLFYTNNTQKEIAYVDFFEEAKTQMPLDLIAVLSKENLGSEFEHGFITSEMLSRRAPDFLERDWYISGPPPMVDAYHKLLLDNGVSKKQIILDYFPGLA